MGNRSSSPSKRRAKSKADPQSPVAVSGDASAVVCAPFAEGDPVRRVKKESVVGVVSVDSKSAQDESTPAPDERVFNATEEWRVLKTTVEAVDAFNRPLRAQQSWSTQLNKDDPVVFFSNSGGNVEDCPYAWYMEALLRVTMGSDHSASSELLWKVVTEENTVAMDARVLLAECLIRMEPALHKRTTRDEILRLLQYVLDKEAHADKKTDISVANRIKRTQELLAHVFTGMGTYEHALTLLATLSDEDQGGAILSVFQRAHAFDATAQITSMKDQLALLSATKIDHGENAMTCLLVDAQALHVGPQ